MPESAPNETPAAAEAGWDRWRRRRWLLLLVTTRLLGAAAAIALLAAHRVSEHDGALIALAIGWTAVSLGAFARSERLQRHAAAWAVDGAVALWLVYVSTDWRSPFYVFAVTALILPATELPLRRALAWGVAWTGGYLAVAILTERLGGETFERAVRLEIVATHLMVPLVVVLALAYSSDVLVRLGRERARAERLAIERERQRIAWELHDSAKQRVHAAHLLLTSLDGRLAPADREMVEHALKELRAATGDMDTSVAELRSPLEGRPVDELVRDRAAELERGGHVPIVVRGELPAMAPLVATHAFRIASEALTNAVRHGDARRIEVVMTPDPPSVVVRDDGVGLPERLRPGSHGLPTMRNRAATIGATIRWSAGPGGRGTTVSLDFQPPPREGASPA
jgi:signal transduction histidine kinase